MLIARGSILNSFLPIMLLTRVLPDRGDSKYSRGHSECPHKNKDLEFRVHESGLEGTLMLVFPNGDRSSIPWPASHAG